MSDMLAARFLGGSPLTVLVRLVVVSLLVGALMSWLGVDPADVYHDAERGLLRLWAGGFAALGDIGRTVAAGAIVVVPIWLAMRVLRFGGSRSRIPGAEARSPEGLPAEPARPARWSSPDRVGGDHRF